jgi:replicative DNA helicase
VSDNPKLPDGVLPDRAQPHALNVERAVLGAMLREPDSCIDLAVGQFGRQEVFYTPAHRVIYSALTELHGQRHNADLVSLAQLLKERGKLDAVGGEIYLAELEGSIATTVNLESWCRTLVKYAMLRRMINVCSTSLMKCYDADRDISDLVDEIESDIYEVRHDDAAHTVYSIQELVANEVNSLISIMNNEVEVGIPTGFASIDEYTGGLKKGEMFVLAARPSIGKTTLGLNVIRNVALHPTKPRAVAFFSLEMTEQQIARRLLCTEAQVSESAFWNHSFLDSDLDKLTRVAEKIEKANIWIDPTGGLSIAELRAKARRLVSQHHVELIVIDYLQLMTADERVESRQQEVAKISGGIKKLAKDLNVPVLVLAQLNREVDKNSSPNARPKLAHLRESGAIEQDADIVTFLHRNRDDTKNNAVTSVEAEWIIEKNRNGRTGVVKLLFYPARMEFVPAAPGSDQFGPQ